jgi:hypothetical protein
MKQGRDSKTASGDFAASYGLSSLSGFQFLLVRSLDLLAAVLFLLIDSFVQSLKEPALFLRVGGFSHV